MKKIFLLATLFVIPTFAAESMTVGDTLVRYFTDIFPHTNAQIENITLKYSGIGNRGSLRRAVKKGVYYSMMPNSAADLNPDRAMTDRAFAQLLRYHFGLKIEADDSFLTENDYARFMSDISSSYVFRLLQAFNEPETDEARITTLPKITNIDDYYLLEKVYELLSDNYLYKDTLEKANLIYGATEGLVNELGDSYTKFFRPEASTDFKNSLDGNIVGIGVIINIDSFGALVVADVIRHSPAEKAGIVTGDRITRVDGMLVTTDNGIADDIARLRGAVGTQVEVTIRSGDTTKTVAIIRDTVHIDQVETEDLSDAYRIIF